MLFPITATMELFNSFETSFSTALPKLSQQENYEWFLAVGWTRRGAEKVGKIYIWVTKKAPESMPVGLG